MPDTNSSTVQLLHLHKRDNVAVLAQDPAGDAHVVHSGLVFALPEGLRMGHKIAVRSIPKGEDVLKYGAPIGFASCDISVGEHVHLHNVTSRYTTIEDMEDGQT